MSVVVVPPFEDYYLSSSANTLALLFQAGYPQSPNHPGCCFFVVRHYLQQLYFDPAYLLWLLQLSYFISEK
jgi:hypothetical protein